MKKTVTISLLIFTALCAPVGRAQTLTPEEVAVEIYSKSPEYNVLHYDRVAADASLATAANLPDPEVEGEFLAAPAGETSRWGAGVNWGIEWPGVYGARRAEAKQLSMVRKIADESAITARMTEIKRMLLDYVAQEKRLGVLRRLDTSTDSLLLMAEKAERGGEMTRLDLCKLRIEKGGIAASISETLAEREDTERALSSAAGYDCRQLLAEMICEFPTLDLPEQLTESIADNSPAVRLANAEAEAARRAVGVASMESLPSLSLGYRHAYEEGIHFNGATLGLSIPLASAKGKKKAAEAAGKAASIRTEAARTAAVEDIRGSVRKLEMLKQRIEAVAPLLEESESETLLLKAYKGGVITLLDYLNERNYFTEATLDLTSLRLAAANALLDIQAHMRP